MNLVGLKNTYYFPPLSSMLASRVCLGTNVFQINIERTRKKKLASVSTIMTGIVVSRSCIGRSNPWADPDNSVRGGQDTYPLARYINTFYISENFIGMIQR